MTTKTNPAPIMVVGLVGGNWFGSDAEAALRNAEFVAGSPRHLEASKVSQVLSPAADRLHIDANLEGLFDAIQTAVQSNRSVCVLASGDPGFFGIVRSLSARFGSESLRVFPAPSSVSLAWAAAGQHWDDAAVVSVHGRDMSDGISTIAALVFRQRKVAVLTSPDSPPHEVCGRLCSGDRAAGEIPATVVSRLGEPTQSVWRGTIADAALRDFDPLSVLLVHPSPPPAPASPTSAWGMAVPTSDEGHSLSLGADEATFAHRSGMITKAEVRAVVLSKLNLGTARLLWDIGAGSGSVGVEAATVQPLLQVAAVERVAADAANIEANARQRQVAGRVSVHVSEALDALPSLHAPDRVFIGGGGLDVLERCWGLLQPGGRLVAAFTMADRAGAAHRLLGNTVAVRIERAVPIADGFRFDPLNPVFVCWGDRS